MVRSKRVIRSAVSRASSYNRCRRRRRWRRREPSTPNLRDPHGKRQRVGDDLGPERSLGCATGEHHIDRLGDRLAPSQSQGDRARRTPRSPRSRESIPRGRSWRVRDIKAENPGEACTHRFACMRSRTFRTRRWRPAGPWPPCSRAGHRHPRLHVALGALELAEGVSKPPHHDPAVEANSSIIQRSGTVWQSVRSLPSGSTMARRARGCVARSCRRRS